MVFNSHIYFPWDSCCKTTTHIPSVQKIYHMWNAKEVYSLKYFHFEGKAALSVGSWLISTTPEHQDNPRGLTWTKYLHQTGGFAKGSQKLCCIRTSPRQGAWIKAVGRWCRTKAAASTWSGRSEPLQIGHRKRHHWCPLNYIIFSYFSCG